MSDARLEDRRGAGDAGADSGLEVAADAGGNRIGAAIGLEAVDIEAELLDPPPEMGIVDVGAVGVERVDHREEGALQAGRLDRRVQGRGARMLAGNREVAEDDRCLASADLRPSRGAVRATEIGVDDQLRPLAAPVILRPWRRHGGAGQLSGQRLSASKIRLAPGISSGVGDSYTHSTVPSSSTRTSERLAWPIFSM